MTENKVQYRFTAYLRKRLRYAQTDYGKALRPLSLPLDTAVSGSSWERMSRCLTPRE